MSQIITFYSYKGGVGRSMALANIATLLSKWGKKVLMIDWDLEAPGLENFFKEYLPDTDWSQQKGVLEWLYAQQNKEEAKWQDWVIPFKTRISKTDLHMLVSGKSNGNYTEMLRAFDVAEFYEKHDGGRAIERFREELLAAYDYVLIDSRTGVTDFGGICTIQLPDMLVMLFTPTEQGLNGTNKFAKRILDSHAKLPFDRFRLLICPVPSKFDSTTEFQESRKWLDRFSKELIGLYEEWLPAGTNLNEFLQILKIPYISYFSFGEKLPVIEQGVSDPAGLGYAYENLAMLIAYGFDDISLFLEDRERYLLSIIDSSEVSIMLDFLLNAKAGITIKSHSIKLHEYTKALIEALKNNEGDWNSSLSKVIELEEADPFREPLKKLSKSYQVVNTAIAEITEDNPLYKKYEGIQISIRIAFLSIMLQMISEKTKRTLNSQLQKGLNADLALKALNVLYDTPS